MTTWNVSKLVHLDLAQLGPLLHESQREGFAFLQRLWQEYVEGINCFAGQGESLYGVYNQRQLVGIGGLQADPYTKDPSLGRLRHLYVSEAVRRQGVGRELVRAVVQDARQVYKLLVLRTNTQPAAAFYQALGFVCDSSIPYATHTLPLTTAESLSQKP
jgi:ribosomal protein S18 acetylase RimI-like enzyme